MLFFVLYMGGKQKDNRGYFEQRFNQLDSLIENKRELDSLYWNHVEVCAFELRDDVQYTYHN